MGQGEGSARNRDGNDTPPQQQGSHVVGKREIFDIWKNVDEAKTNQHARPAEYIATTRETGLGQAAQREWRCS